MPGKPRVEDRPGEPAAAIVSFGRCSGDGGVEVVDVHQRHAGHDAVERACRPTTRSRRHRRRGSRCDRAPAAAGDLGEARPRDRPRSTSFPRRASSREILTVAAAKVEDALTFDRPDQLEQRCGDDDRPPAPQPTRRTRMRTRRSGHARLAARRSVSPIERFRLKRWVLAPVLRRTPAVVCGGAAGCRGSAVLVCQIQRFQRKKASWMIVVAMISAHDHE